MTGEYPARFYRTAPVNTFLTSANWWEFVAVPSTKGKMVFGCLGCCVWPHGKCSMFALFLGVLAYMLLSVAIWGCTYMRIDGYLYHEDPYMWHGSTKWQTSQVGLFSYQELSNFGSAETEYVCATYTKDMIKNFLDLPFRAARSFAAFANVFMGIGALVLLLSSCAYYEVILLRRCGWLFIVGSVFQMLTFVLFASDITSEPHNGSFWWGSGLALAAAIVSLFAGIVTLNLPVSENESKNQTSSTGSSSSLAVSEQPRAMRPGTETTTETILPDGRRKYTTTKWNKDGNAIVEESIV